MKIVQCIGIMALATALFAAGCATKPETEVHLATSGGGMYSSLDATAQVYSNPMSQAPLEDHPFRWVGYVMHPIGLAMDYFLNRPIHAAASTVPTASGYTSEDVLINSQRRK
jgi:hypothetical protein